MGASTACIWPRLYRHYGLEYSEHRSDSGMPAGTADDNQDRVGRHEQR